MEEFLTGTQLSIPLVQVAGLLTLTTLSLVFGRIKLALLISYCFTLYWGYFLNLDNVTGTGPLIMNSFTLAYFGFGLAVVTMAFVGFIAQRE